MFKEKYNSSISKHNPSDELIERTRKLMESPPKRSNKIVWKYAINISAACLLIVAVTVAYQLIPNNIEFIASEDQIVGNNKMQNAAGAMTPNEAARSEDKIPLSSTTQQMLGGSVQYDNILNKVFIDDLIVKYSTVANQQEQTTLETAISTTSDVYNVNELAAIAYPAKKISSDDVNVQTFELTDELIIENFGENFGFYIPEYMSSQLPYSYEVTTKSTGKYAGTETLRCFSFDFTQSVDGSSLSHMTVRAYPTSYSDIETVRIMQSAVSNYVGSTISDIEVYLGIGIDLNSYANMQIAEFIKDGMLYQILTSGIPVEDFAKTLYTILQA